MTGEPVEILLIEDDPNDVELTLRALKKHNVTNRVYVARERAGGLDFIFARGQHLGRNLENGPRLC